MRLKGIAILIPMLMYYWMAIDLQTDFGKLMEKQTHLVIDLLTQKPRQTEIHWKKHLLMLKKKVTVMQKVIKKLMVIDSRLVTENQKETGKLRR